MDANTSTTWIDKSIRAVAPRWHLKRVRARLAADIAQRHYEGAATGRRTQGWSKGISDPNAASAGALAPLRNVARDLVRNNPYAESALSTIVDHAVGWGIKATKEPKAWRQWAESTDCDADGRHDFCGLQKLVMRTVVESGECLVRGRFRRSEDGLPIPLQLQVLEPDYIDTNKSAERLPNGGRIIQGIEFDALGRRVAYWLFRDHPGAESIMVSGSQRVPADLVLHIFKGQRPGQVRGVTWFAPVLLTFKDFDNLEDATLMKQKVAACLSVITTDEDGESTPIGVAVDGVDTLSPGAILNIASGRKIDVVNPPTVGEYPEYSETQQRKIAAGLGVPFSDMTGNYTRMNFSASRMELIRHWRRVDDWQWRLMVPQFCNPVWAWARQAAAVMGGVEMSSTTDWNTPPMPMVDPDKEGLAAMRNVRAGVQTLSQVIRERGYNPDTFLDELADDFRKLDKRGLVLDVDPRQMTQAGQAQQPASPAGDAQPGDPGEEDPPAAEDGRGLRRVRVVARR